MPPTSPPPTADPQTPPTAGPAGAGPLTISWDDLSAPAVERTLKERDAVSRTKEHFETATVPAAARGGEAGWRRWWTWAPFHLTLFGLLGGALGWGLGLPLHLRADPRVEARQLIAEFDDIAAAQAAERVTPAEADVARRELDRAGAGNSYYRAHAAPGLSDAERQTLTLEAGVADRRRDLFRDAVFYAIAGACVAALLAAAGPTVDGDRRSALVNGVVGATLGAVGGLAVGFVVGRLYAVAVGGEDSAYSLARQSAARAASFAVLGLFLAAAPGVVMGSIKRMLVGMLGGAIAGAVAGLAFDPLVGAAGPHVARLACLAGIGALAGLGSALVEDALKAGWLKVASGVIAGKQFVLYRDPTFVGSAPMSHIYLWKDPAVGRRHAAIHHARGGGFEVENLPPGGPTLLNGKPVARAKLRTGDRIEVGRTAFVFEEKEKK